MLKLAGAAIAVLVIIFVLLFVLDIGILGLLKLYCLIFSFACLALWRGDQESRFWKMAGLIAQLVLVAALIAVSTYLLFIQ